MVVGGDVVVGDGLYCVHIIRELLFISNNNNMPPKFKPSEVKVTFMSIWCAAVTM
jgi:hypothetical protein